MAIAPQNIMTKLRGMGDAELAQYAQMHQQDPYIFPLAFQESQNRQHLRASKQAQMAGQTPPKVVQQDIAEMAQAVPQALPEEVGIGALPAQNMQRMAGGGIVAFADGGDVQHYDAGGRVTVADVQAAYDAWQQTMPSVGSNQTLTGGAKEAQAKDNYMRVLQAFQTQPSNVQPGGAPQSAPATQVPAYDAATQQKGTQLLEAMRDSQPSGIETLTKTPSATNAAGIAGTGGSSNLSADVPSTKGFMQQLEGYLGKREEAPKQADIEKQLEERQKPYMDKLTETIEGQRDKLKTGREEAIYMAMIKGGFAAAAGTSPNALANIAKGGEAGIADLSESMKDLRKAAQEQHKMELELTKAKMDASTGNLKTAWERQDKAKQIQADRDKIMATAFSNITDATIRSNATVKAAGIGAGADQRMLEALGSAQPDSALVKGFNMKQEMLKRATLTETWSKLAYPTGNMGQPNEAFLARFPSAEVYIKEAMAAEQPGGGGAPGPNAGMQRTR